MVTHADLFTCEFTTVVCLWTSVTKLCIPRAGYSQAPDSTSSEDHGASACATEVTSVAKDHGIHYGARNLVAV